MDLTKISAGKLPNEVNVFIEIPQGSSIKYELDKDSGVMMVDRFIHTAMSYPFNYGFVPQTHADDGDPIDVLVLSACPVYPGCVMRCRTIGMLEMEDEAGTDTKILAVPVSKLDPTYDDIKDVKDLPASLRAKIEHFFQRYKELEPGKWVKVKAFLGTKEAQAAIAESVKAYSAKHS